MNATSWTPWIRIVGIVSLLTLGASFVNAQTTNSNNLTVLGYVDAINEIFYGNAVNGGATNSAVSLNYSDALHEIGLLSSQPSSIFIWQDNGISSTPSNKMKLDGSNNLTLYSTNASNGIVLNPTTGGLQLKGTGAGITLVDGTCSDFRGSGTFHSSLRSICPCGEYLVALVLGLILLLQLRPEQPALRVRE